MKGDAAIQEHNSRQQQQPIQSWVSSTRNPHPIHNRLSGTKPNGREYNTPCVLGQVSFNSRGASPDKIVWVSQKCNKIQQI